MHIVNKIFLHVVLAIVYFGFVLPFLMSHKSIELPIIGAASLVGVLYYSVRELVTYLNRKGGLQ